MKWLSMLVLIACVVAPTTLRGDELVVHPLDAVRLPVPDTAVLERPSGDPFAIPGYTIKKAPTYFEAEEQRITRAQELNGRNLKTRAVGAGQTVRTGLSAGSVGQRVFLTVATGTVSGLIQGRSMGESLRTVRDDVATEEFLIGRVGGATLGAAMASMLPMPAIGGLLGRVISPLPALSAALILGGIGSEVVAGWKAGHVDLGEILRNLDVTGTLAQALGSSLCMGIAATMPIGTVGVALAGIVGAFVGEWAVAAFRDATACAVQEVSGAITSRIATEPATAETETAAAPMSGDARSAYRKLVLSLREGSRDVAAGLLRSYRSARGDDVAP